MNIALSLLYSLFLSSTVKSEEWKVNSEEMKSSQAKISWWAQVDSNHRPRAYQARALTTWAMSPCKFLRCISSLSPLCTLGFCFRFLPSSLAAATCRWWRWWGSNPWPPACRAGALPAELHPHLGFSFLLNDISHSKLNNKSSVPAQALYTSLIHLGFCLLRNTADPRPWRDLPCSP